ncbi:hypothetical protein ACGRSR_18070 [Vibrio owensii]|jgi:hypothetical protein|uniref:hypothetical protein n=1 Tax=Vibrio owensii TaxID=696485 RepID=UPI002FEAE1B1
MAKVQDKNGNPLIKGNKADTINEIHNHIEWLCLASDSDEGIHPGLIQSLNMVREAVKALKEPELT